MPSQAQVLLLLQQAIPQNPKQCSPAIAKLGFSSFVSCCPPLGSRNMPLISSSSISFSWSSSPVPVIAPQPPNLAFVVRADSNPEGGGGGEAFTTDNVEEDAASDNVDQFPEAQVEQLEEPKPPRKPRVKLGDIMGILNQRAIEASEKERPTPDIRTGDIVEIKLEVPENKRRLSIYKGIAISKQNAGIHTTIRIRRIIAGVGVEIVFPVYSPNIKEIKVVSHRKVRRARLYYLRDKLPRFSTFK